MTLLNSFIEKAVEKFYAAPYLVDPWANDIISIERPNGFRTFYFIVKLRIMPYTGPHNTVGVDEITLSVSYGPEVKVIKFEHIEDTPLITKRR